MVLQWTIASAFNITCWVHTVRAAVHARKVSRVLPHFPLYPLRLVITEIFQAVTAAFVLHRHFNLNREILW